MREETKVWWQLVEKDLVKATVLSKAKQYDGTAFYSQQAVEKACKALWIKKMSVLHQSITI